MKKIILVITFILLAGLGWWWFSDWPEPQPLVEEPVEEGEPVEEYSAEIIDEGREIKVTDRIDQTVLSFSIEDFNTWTVEHWDELFPAGVSFGELRAVEPGQFGRFDSSAVVSPDNKRLAWSVSGYAAATTISFVGVMEIDTGSIDLVKEEVMGSIEELIWSPDSTHLAYGLHSARARGDNLSVDNVLTLEKQFTLGIGALGLLDQLDPRPDIDEAQFMPDFRALKWSPDSEVLYFTTDHPENGDIDWRIDRDGSGLEPVEGF